MTKHPDDVVLKVVKPVKLEQELIHFQSYKASQIQVEPQTWLWDGYIPLQTCTLFAGTGGIGKSTLLAYLVSAVSNGASFTVTGRTFTMPKGSVVMLSAEDSIKKSIVPRLIANDANLDNIEIIESSIEVNTKQVERFVALDRDMFVLDQKIKEINKGDLPVKLIILDPVTAYIGNLKDNNSVEVRNFILQLNKIAERHDLSIILNTHTRKKSGKNEGSGTAADEVMGSSAWYNTVRQAFSITKHHDDDDLIVFINSKSNCGKKPEPLSYRIESAQISDQGNVIDISRINWQLDKIDMTADEAVHEGLYEKRLLIDQAKDFILDELAFGSKKFEELEKKAEANGITARTLKRARQLLTKAGTNIIMEQSHMDKRKMIWYIGN